MSSTTLPNEMTPTEPKDQSEPTIVEFDGKDDDWDPKNFSKLKKWVILIAVTHGAVIVTCASSLYVSPPPYLLRHGSRGQG